jgi:hypothetical protein
MEATDLRNNFLGWQCRVRQIAMRDSGGRPSTGMRPLVSLTSDGNFSDEITVLLIRREAGRDASQFRHMVLKTQDPAARYESAMQLLSATYYQRPHEFSDELTGLFQPSMLLVRALLARGDCVLDFQQFSASYRLPCFVRRLREEEPAYQATYWHNCLFNSSMPGNIVVLGFLPDWNSAEGEPV